MGTAFAPSLPSYPSTITLMTSSGLSTLVKPMNQEIIDKVIPGEERITCRYADMLENEMNKLEGEMKEWKQQDEDVLSYALFPQVATDFFKYRQAQQDKVDMTQADTKNGAYPV